MRRLALLLPLVGACSQTVEDPSLEGPIPFSPERPGVSAATTVAPYTGTNASVREAQDRLPTGLDLHAKVIYRTCTPNGGVCHNTKEYPDLHTPANFLAAVDSACNVQPGTPESVYDRCERPGDRFKLNDGPEREVGYLNYVPGDPKGVAPSATSPGLHVYLGDALPSKEKEQYGTARFIRQFVDKAGAVQELPFARFQTNWAMLDGGKHLVGRVADYQTSDVQELLTLGIVQGDQNRNGVFGARMAPPIPLLRPGKPDESYLIGRLRGVMFGGSVPGSRMPLANQPLSVPEMLALFCWVEGLARQQRPYNIASQIDYQACSYSKNPESLNLLGSGVTWAGRIKNILEFNCGGCHSGADPQAGLILLGNGVYANLLKPSTQKPEMALIKAKDPMQSYLWLKLNGGPGIIGSRMPLNPLNGAGKLTDAELADIKTWIEAGAVEAN